MIGEDEYKTWETLPAFAKSDPSLYVELGDREAELGRTADARRHYQRALEIDPYYAPAKQRLAALGS